MKNVVRVGAVSFTLALAACTTPSFPPPAKSHLGADEMPAATGEIPAPVQQTLALPAPKVSARPETYSVVVNNVRVQDLLFALARDAKLNVDVHPGINGTVTLNAIDQTLPQLLTRISKQVDMRWEMDGPNLMVMPDSPYLRNYKVDYVNMSRDTSGTVAVTTQIASNIPGAATSGGATNNSVTKIDNLAKNHFWDTLIQNIKDLLRETDKILPEGSSETLVEQAASQAGISPPAPPAARSSASQAATYPGGQTSQQSAGTTVVKRVTFREAASVIANPETGVLSVRGTARQQEKVQEFIDQVASSAKRQVLIEATIVEVRLSQNYQQGVDWGRLRTDASRSGIIGATAGPIIGSTAGNAQLVFGRAADKSADGAIRLLEEFGNVKVLSSPKISVLNNQSAVIKVVDNRVYFTVKADTTPSNVAGGQAVVAYTTTPYQVPVGFVMNVTPQISENNSVILNLRPSISRVVDEVRDPNPALRPSGDRTGPTTEIPNLIPVIRSREMESIMRVENGNVAVLGGLMEDEKDAEDSAVPFFNRIPLLGALFTQRKDSGSKTELVIFLRPTIIREASVNGDYKSFRDRLPGSDFFNKGFAPPSYQVLPSTPSGALQ